MMSTPVSRIQTADGAVDQYDHEISLVDTTAPDATQSRSDSPTRDLTRKPTTGSFRRRIANRKYRRWQEARQPKNGLSATDDTNEEEISQEPQPAEGAIQDPGEVDAVDFAKGVRKSRPTKRKEDPSEIDVLYENQRGTFFLGIPFYSHSSLLNFDPAPWITKDLKDSAVNITNAQVPDPSWEWTWKRWYVDMSHDVDEEGWQYSFSFGNKFVWHGTHPWFHSFVRRRRWLRKRVKTHGHQKTLSGKPETMSIAHNLNTDYFTIHPKRTRSPDSKRPESYASIPKSVQAEEPPDEIKDIATLLHSLKLATIDREKIDMVKKFIDQGGDELAYLRSHIPEIMSSLIFQNSATQLLSILKDAVSAAQAHGDEHSAEKKSEGDEEQRRIDNLLAAIDAADEQRGGLEYWSNRKHVLQTFDGTSENAPTVSTIFDKPVPEPQAETHPAEGIRGIPADAEVDVDPTHEFMHEAHDGGSHEVNGSDGGLLKAKGKGKGKGKGKEKEKESESRSEQTIGTKTGSEQKEDGEDESSPSSPPRLKTDQVLIPDA